MASADDVAMVRLLISDTDDTAYVFTGEEIGQFLTLEGGAVRLAAAQALDTLASNEALVSKVIHTQKLSTDGPKVAAELRARAGQLRAQHEDGVGDADVGGLEIVDFDPFAVTGLGW